MSGFKWRWTKAKLNKKSQGIFQLILLSWANSYLIKCFNSEIRSQAKDNENWNVWERSPAKEKGSSHLLSPSYPSIILGPLSARVFIRRERSHLSRAFLSGCGEVNNGREAFIFHINIINRKALKCQRSQGQQVQITGWAHLVLLFSRASSSCDIY